MSTHDNALISTDDLAARLGSPDLHVFDVTAGPVPLDGKDTPADEAFLQGHIPSAAWIDQQALSDQDSPFRFMAPPPEVVAAYLEHLGVNDRSTIVLYSTTAYGWATRLWWLLHGIGLDQVYVLDGGWKKWQAEHRPQASGPAEPRTPSATPLTLRPREVFVDRQRVLQAVEQGDAQLVDALGAAQYNGDTPSKNGRRGHIKNAVNLPNTQVVNATDNTFLSPERLAEAFAERELVKDRTLITYCGAGIAASIDAFAARQAGYPDVRIYDASLAEWAKDPQLPMVPGTP